MQTGFRVALIGYGAWGAVLAKAVERNPRLTLSAIVSANPTAADAYPDTPIHATLEDLFAAGIPDAAVIATGPDRHVATGIDCVSRGIPCFIEKPVALSVAEVERLRAATVAHGRGVHVDYVLRHKAAFQALLEALPRIAPIREIRSEGGKNRPIRDGYASLWDYGPHDASMILAVAPERLVVEACTVSRAPNGARGYAIDYRAGSVTGHARVGTDFAKKTRRFVVTGAGGTLIHDDLAEAPLTLDGAPLPVPDTGATALDIALDRFADGLAAGGSESLFLEETVAITAFLAAAERIAA